MKKFRPLAILLSVLLVFSAYAPMGGGVYASSLLEITSDHYYVNNYFETIAKDGTAITTKTTVQEFLANIETGDPNDVLTLYASNGSQLTNLDDNLGMNAYLEMYDDTEESSLYYDIDVETPADMVVTSTSYNVNNFIKIIKGDITSATTAGEFLSNVTCASIYTLKLYNNYELNAYDPEDTLIPNETSLYLYDINLNEIEYDVYVIDDIHVTSSVYKITEYPDPIIESKALAGESLITSETTAEDFLENITTSAAVSSCTLHGELGEELTGNDTLAPNGTYLEISDGDNRNKYEVIVYEAGSVVLNNGKIKFGENSSSINENGILLQPWYYSTIDAAWNKLTFGDYGIDYAIGVGMDIAVGMTEYDSDYDEITVENQITTTDSYTSQSAFMGYGTVVSTADVLVYETPLKVVNTYSLGENSSFIKVVTKVTNTSDAEVADLKYWVGTQDDYIAGSDYNAFKERGNLIGGEFVGIDDETSTSNAIQISGNGASVLLFSTSEKAQSIIGGNCGIDELLETNPLESWIKKTGDASYGLSINLADLAAGASDEFTWYYGAGAVADMADITSDVAADNEAGSDEILTCSEGTTSFNIGSGDGSVVDSQVAITAGDNEITGAKVIITTGFDKVGDTLSFTSSTSISGIYDATRGTLTLSGTAPATEYESALRSVKFKTTSTSAGIRTIAISIGGDMLYNPTNGHFYEYVLPDAEGFITWTDARAAAATRTFYGQTGYLTTITSQAENEFIRDKLASNAWIGASDRTTEGSWVWDVATASESGITFYEGDYENPYTYPDFYSNWDNGEPNNAESENFAYMYNVPAEGRIPGTWNDYANNGQVQGYIAEYNTVTGAADTKSIEVKANVLTAEYIWTITKPEQVKNKLRFNVDKIDSFLTSGSAIEELHPMDVAPMLFEERTLLPIRFVVEPLGGKILWSPAERKVTITRGTTSIELWIGSNIAKVNGVEQTIDPDNLNVKPILVGHGRTMLPLRFISEALGCTVNWNQTTQEIEVTDW